VPDDFLLGLYLPIHAGLDVDVEHFYIASVAVFANGYNISIGYNDGSASPPIIATAVISVTNFTPNSSYALPGAGAFDDTAGKLVIGVLDSISLQPTGQFTFNYQGGKLDSDCIRPMIRGIQSIRVLNNGELSAPMTGHVILAAGTNFQITCLQVPGLPGQITFNAIDGAGLTTDCSCQDTASTGPIMTINGIGPDKAGNFKFNGSQCLEIDPISNGLHLNDVCSSPCCGCAELEQITQELQLIGTGQQTLENFVNNLGTQMNAMSQIVLGSRIQDQGCIQC
jgi:hypothetical protein